MFKCLGVYSRWVCLRECVIADRGKTVSVFLTEALGRFEVWFKWSMSEEFLYPCIDSSEEIPLQLSSRCDAPKLCPISF